MRIPKWFGHSICIYVSLLWRTTNEVIRGRIQRFLRFLGCEKETVLGNFGIADLVLFYHSLFVNHIICLFDKVSMAVIL